MDIVIPTYGRAGRQITFDNLPPFYKEKVRLVVQKREEHLYPNYATIVLPDHMQDIASTRHYLIHECLELHHRKICMLDDDLVFSARREDDPTKFRPMQDTDFAEMFWEVSIQLDDYAHVGVSHREGANRNTDQFVDVTRQMRVLAFHKPTMQKEGIDYGRIPVMEDFDTTLRLLRRGYPNRLCNRWVHNQGGSDVSGGCSTFRTPEMQEEASKKLAELHPGFVKVVKKTTKTSWGGGERTDVTIYWKRAYRSSQA